MGLYRGMMSAEYYFCGGFLGKCLEGFGDRIERPIGFSALDVQDRVDNSAIFLHALPNIPLRSVDRLHGAGKVTGRY